MAKKKTKKSKQSQESMEMARQRKAMNRQEAEERKTQMALMRELRKPGNELLAIRSDTLRLDAARVQYTAYLEERKRIVTEMLVGIEALPETPENTQRKASGQALITKIDELLAAVPELKETIKTLMGMIGNAQGSLDVDPVQHNQYLLEANSLFAEARLGFERTQGDTQRVEQTFGMVMQPGALMPGPEMTATPEGTPVEAVPTQEAPDAAEIETVSDTDRVVDEEGESVVITA